MPDRLYRLMKVAADGGPVVGSGSMMLGVRPFDPSGSRRFDVPAVTGTDAVRPGAGGLSCYDDPAAITLQVGRLALWSIDPDELPPELEPQPAGPPHYHIGPAREMSLDDLQQLLADTRDLWNRE